MTRIISVLALALSVLASIGETKNVTQISDCPALTPRNGPRDASDLRPDDIKVLGALGDRQVTVYSTKTKQMAFL